MRLRLAVIGLVVLLAFAAGAVAFAENSGSTDTVHHAGLVVTFPDHTETFWIEFSEDQISGADLLQRSGLDVTFSGYGGLGAGVCQIEGVGCANPGDCFCQCRSGTCDYWVYFKWSDNQWVTSPLGADSRELKDGDVDGWAWGPGTPPQETLTPIPCPTPTPPITAPPTAEPTDPPTAEPTPAQTFGATATEASLPTPTVASPAALGATATPSPLATVTPGVSGTFARTPSASPPGAESSDGGGFPWGIAAFGGIAMAMVVATGAIVVSRRNGV